MVLPLPMIKFGGLVVRTLTKPLAKVVKSRSKVDPSLNRVCHALGQQQHQLVMRFHMGYRGISNFTIKDLPADQAVEKGADLIGELIIFSVALTVATFEYSRSTTKSKEKERAEAEKKQLQEEATERRFEELEDKVIWLEAQLAALGRIVEHDLDQRIEEAENEGGVVTVLAPRRRKDSNASDAATAATETSSGDGDGNATSASGIGGLWAATYSSVAGLFRRSTTATLAAACCCALACVSAWALRSRLFVCVAPVDATALMASRLTRGALRKLNNSSHEDDQESEDATLLREYTTFQSGLPATKRRRTASGGSSSAASKRSSTSESTADAENQPPADHHDTSTETKMTAATPVKAAATPKKKKTPETPVVCEGVVVVAVTPPTATTTVIAPTVAELALAQEEKALVGAPEGELFVVTLLASDEITPSADVDAEIAEMETVMAAKQSETASDAAEDLSWAKEYAALDSLRRIAIHHRDRLDELVATRGVVAKLVCPGAMNLRSSMVRNALICVKDLVVALKGKSDDIFGDVVRLLVQRTSHEKHFIRELAREVLATCIETSPSEALLVELLGMSTTEKNAQIVSSAGMYAQKCIGKMNKTHLKTFATTTHASFVEEMSAFLNCKVVECKAATRKTLQYLRRTIGDAEFTTLVKSKLEGTSQFEFLKASQEAKAPPTKLSGLPRLSMRERMLQMKKQQQAANGGDGIDEIVVLVPEATR